MERVAKFYKVSKEQFLGDMAEERLFPTESAYENLELPKRATKGSAGYDFYSPIDFKLKPGQTIKIPTGIRCKMSQRYSLFILPRSGLGFKYKIFLCNTLGLIDSDYYESDNEGHIMIKLMNCGDTDLRIKEGDKICQGVFLLYGITMDDDCDGVRNGGFGSTGK